MKGRTLVIIKPDAVKKKVIGKIIERFEEENFRIVNMKMLHLRKEDAMRFYRVHENKPFYSSLCEFMSSGPVVIMILEGEMAVQRVREIMGATDPLKAEKGTIRNLFGTDVEKNAIHGSDSEENAEKEIDFFFSKMEQD